MSFVADIADYLESGSAGTVGIDLFRWSLPDAPNGALGVIEYPGETGFEVLCGLDDELPRCQLVGRDLDEETAYDRVRIAYDVLRALSEVSIGGVTYVEARAIQPPFFLKFDERTRPYFATNFVIRRQL